MRLIFLITMLFSVQTFAAGRLQDSDFKTVTQLVNAGASAASLLNDTKIYVSANGINQTLNSAVASGLIGGGAGINLVGNGSFEASGIAGWTTFTTTLTGGTPTGTVGTCTTCSLAISANTSAPLNGKASLQLAAASSVTAGQGFISNSFSVLPAYRGQVMTIKGVNSLVSGAPAITGDSTGTFAIYVYDTTAGAWIQPSGTYGITSATGQFAPVSFQIPSTTQLMRIAIVAVNSLATPTTLLFDDLAVAPGLSGGGYAARDFRVTGVNVISSTGAPATVLGKGTTTFDSIGYAQAGDHALIKFEFKQTSAGTTGTAGDYLFLLPNGLSFDSTKVSFFTTVIGAGSIVSPVGLGTIAISDGTSDLVGQAIPYDATHFRIAGVQTAANGNGYSRGFSSTTYFALSATNLSIRGQFLAPIAGFQTNVTQSSDYDGRNVTFTGAVTSSTSATANTTAIALTTVADRAGAWTGSSYVVPAAGDYSIAGPIVTSGTTTIVAYVNGVARTNLGSNATGGTARFALSGSITGLKVSDVITLRVDQNVTINASSLDTITIARVPGSTPVIQASQSIIASYGLTAAQSVGAAAPVKYDTKITDNSNICSNMSTTGLCTLNMSGSYELSVVSFTSSAGSSLYAMVNGVAAGYVSTPTGSVTGGSIIFSALAGQTVGVYNDAGTQSLSATSASRGFLNRMSLKRVGN